VNPAETLYSFPTPYPTILAIGRAQVVKAPVYRDGALVAPTISGSSYSLLKPDGTALIDARAITVVADVATCSLTGSDLPTTVTPLGEGWQEVWTLVLSDRTETFDREAAVAKRPLLPVVSDADLLGVYPTLNTQLGSTLTSWQNFIDEAWKEIIGLLISEGHLPYLIKSGWAFRRAHTELALANLFGWQGMHTPGRGNFLDLAKHHRELFNKAWSRINFRTDDDHDTRADDNERRRSTSAVLHINTAPTRHMVRDPRW
jgi:hypothetical protein